MRAVSVLISGISESHLRVQTVAPGGSQRNPARAKLSEWGSLFSFPPFPEYHLRFQTVAPGGGQRNPVRAKFSDCGRLLPFPLFSEVVTTGKGAPPHRLRPCGRKRCVGAPRAAFLPKKGTIFSTTSYAHTSMAALT